MKFNTRLHLIVPVAEVAAVEAALAGLPSGPVRFVASAKLKATHVIASGQWTATEAAAIDAALAGFPSAVVARGYADGAEDEGAVEVKAGDDASRVAGGKARKSLGRVLSERGDLAAAGQGKK